MIDPEIFRVLASTTMRLKDCPTIIKPFYQSKKDYRQLLENGTKELGELQNILNASGKYALLIIFQAMDAAGKDGAIRHVMSGINPQGCHVHSFKQPTEKELKHDFLWRAACVLPDRGEIGIFNRSYYEDVLIVKVHPEILDKQNLPEMKAGTDLWEERYQSIRDFEAHLHRNGTRIIKFFLHISKEEQRKRLLERIDIPDKNWKLSLADFEERQYWDQYMDAFEKCILATTTDDCPWYFVPADDKNNARLIISSIILKTLQDMKLSYPRATKNHYAQLEMLRKKLEE